MKYFLISLFFFAELSFGESSVIIESDTAAFRLQNKVIFVSELEKYREQLNTFRCFKQKSILLEALKLDRKTLPQINSFKQHNADLLEKRKPLIKNLVSLLKAQIFANKHKLSVESKTIKELGTKTCIQGDWDSWNNELRLMIQAELFFRERFKKSSSSSLEVDRDKESIQLLLKTIDKKIEHEFFF